MSADVILVFKWWLYILPIGILFLPLAQNCFKGFFDKGYVFSKVIGILILSYSTWLISSTGIMKLTRHSVIFIILVFLPIRQFFFKDFDLKAFVRTHKWAILGEELLFLLLLLFWCYIRGLQPNISGLEKYMDFGFVNAIIRAEHMPPVDIWFAGKSINYYYFGHFICAYLTVLTNIDPAITYNIMLATIFSFSFLLTFSAAGNLLYLLKKYPLKKVIIAGLISASLLSLGGNLHGFIYGYARPMLSGAGLMQPAKPEYYYPQSTRYIGYNPSNNDKTIHEFPIYSFVVSDLHGHVSDIPVVLTFIALLLSLFPEAEKERGPNKGKLLLMALLLSVMYMTNTWDYPIYITVMIIALLYFNIYFSNTIKKALLQLAAVVALTRVLVLPYSLNFKGIASGVGFVHYHTPLYQLLVLWGHQLFYFLCFAVFVAVIISKLIKNNNADEGSKFKKLAGLIRSMTVPDIFCLIISLCALGLVAMPEVVYVRDIYYQGYHRANTMFKLTYQAFIMLGIVTGYIAVRVASEVKVKHLKYLLAAAFIIMYILPMSYLPLALKGYYGSLKPSNYKGIYGLNFLKEENPGDYDAVKWFNENVKGQPTILEANGDSYSKYCRISMATGLPTVQGWFVHEWLWRNDRNEPLNRGKEVETVYESQDDKATWDIIRKYDIKYIIIGSLERQKYKNLNESKLLSLGDVVFESQGTKIIKVR